MGEADDARPQQRPRQHPRPQVIRERGMRRAEDIRQHGQVRAPPMARLAHRRGTAPRALEPGVEPPIEHPIMRARRTPRQLTQHIREPPCTPEHPTTLPNQSGSGKPCGGDEPPRITGHGSETTAQRR
ncbi:MAG: hypothetical protein H0U76_07780 [Ktedonobacteraceae bacterium]|nr:hypothetical protein [Ktedonobacteraceae bacterium]